VRLSQDPRAGPASGDDPRRAAGAGTGAPGRRTRLAETAWLVPLAGGALAVAAHALPARAAGDVVTRTFPVLAFLLGITVVADLADEARVFDTAARAASRVARGRVVVLWLLVVALATGVTVLLGLDATAVLLTPVVLAACTRLGLAVVPFAVTTVWLANTASLLLPVSNLTNLLAAHRLGVSPVGYASRMAAPALVAVVGTAAVLGVRYGRSLRGRYTVPAALPVPDRALFRAACAVCAGVVVLLGSGVDAPVVAVVAGAALALVFLVRRRDALGPHLVPWRLALGVLGLFLLVETARLHGAGAWVAHLVGAGEGPLALLRLAGCGALLSNVIDNLPAYLLVEPAAGSGDRLGALLVGTDVGPLVTPWASLATLLWASRCRARGVRVPWAELVLLGLVGAPLLVAAGALALAA